MQALQQRSGLRPVQRPEPCTTHGRPSRAPSVAAAAQFRRSPSPIVAAVVYKTPVPAKPRFRYVGHAAAQGPPDATRASWVKSLRAAGARPLPQISVSDEAFRELGVEFLSAREGIKVAELNELFNLVGFPRRDPDRLRAALDNTHRLVWVRATKQGRLARLGQLLGFARATSDGVFTATIWDVAVSPAWQRSGLGRAMMERLTRGLVEDGIPNITLYAEPQVVGLYKKLGFKEDTSSSIKSAGGPPAAPLAKQGPAQQLAAVQRVPAAAAAVGRR